MAGLIADRRHVKPHPHHSTIGMQVTLVEAEAVDLAAIESIELRQAALDVVGMRDIDERTPDQRIALDADQGAERRIYIDPAPVRRLQCNPGGRVLEGTRQPADLGRTHAALRGCIAMNLQSCGSVHHALFMQELHQSSTSLPTAGIGDQNR